MFEYKEHDIQGWTIPAFRITSGFNSFEECGGEARKTHRWRLAYFEVLSYKNTWGAPYMVDIKEWNLGHGETEPYLLMVVDADHKDKIVDYLEWQGYGDIKVEETSILCVSDDEVYEKFGYIQHIVQM